MVEQNDIEARETKHGEKMIEVKVRFWTDKLTDDPEKIIPKHAWASGVVRIKGNKSHGIKPEFKAHFSSLMDIPSAIEQVLTAHNIKLRMGPQMKKYFS